MLDNHIIILPSVWVILEVLLLDFLPIFWSKLPILLFHFRLLPLGRGLQSSKEWIAESWMSFTSPLFIFGLKNEPYCVHNLYIWWRAEIMLKDRYGVLANSFWAQNGCEKAMRLWWQKLSIRVIFHVCFHKWIEQNSTSPIPQSCLVAKFKSKTQTQRIREPHAKSASCRNRKCCNVCKLICTNFSYTHHIIVIYSRIVALQTERFDASLGWSLMTDEQVELVVPSGYLLLFYVAVVQTSLEKNKLL